MDSTLEKKLRDIIKRETSLTAIQEWNNAQKNSEEPLYNYRFDHVELVVKLSQHLAEETNADYDQITMAGWLHDAAKPGLGGVKNHGELSAIIAREVLSNEGVNSETIDLVCEAIKKHVGLTLEKPLEFIEAQILWDADKILKLGVVGFIHYILNGIRIQPGMTITEIATRLREFISLAEKIASSMNTNQGKKIAQERLETLCLISNKLDDELKIIR